LKSKILGNSITYTDVLEGYQAEAFEQAIGAHSSYDLKDASHLSEVTEKVVADLKSTNALFKVAIVNIDESIPTNALDAIVKQIETPAEAFDSKLLVVIAGKESSQVSDDALRSPLILAETHATQTLKDDTTPGIMKYLFPNALIAILFMLFVLSILIGSFLILMEVQTPTYFPTESIDFGKIEK